FIRGRIRSEQENPVSRGLIRAYRPLLAGALRHRRLTLGAVALLLVATVFPFSRLGSEFMPPVEEGTILFMPMTLPGVSIQQAASIMQRQNAIIAGMPEVASVVGKTGRANTATEDRKSTRLNSSHVKISYAVFCLKKKKKKKITKKEKHKTKTTI